MAVDTTIPSSSNNVGNDLSAIRENFELLASAQVVDEGTTSDGDYIRYENGWQICISTVTTGEISIDETEGALYINGDDISVTFASSFLEEDWDNHEVSISLKARGGNLLIAPRAFRHNPTFDFRVLSARDRTTSTSVIAIAIGRWK